MIDANVHTLEIHNQLSYKSFDSDVVSDTLIQMVTQLFITKFIFKLQEIYQFSD